MNLDPQILYPMFTLFCFTHLVMGYMLFLRVSGVKKGEIDPKYFKTYDIPVNLPNKTKQVARHYANLMEIPVLFYIICVVVAFKGEPSSLVLSLAWAFVGLRIIHGIIHMTSNKIVFRLVFFAASLVANFVLWQQALFN